MSKKNSKFNIPNPIKELKNLDSNPKYTFGEAVNKLNEIKNTHPIFAFDYISLNNSDYCFNSNRIAGGKDYGRLFQCLKNISTKSYNELSKDNSYHFHEVDFNDTTIPHSDFLKCLVKNTNKINIDHSPTVYQFKAFEEARVLGFVYSGVFYLIFFDRNHNAYKRK